MESNSDEIDRINKELASFRGSSRAADGSVVIETDPSGRITYLYIADYAMDKGPDQLSRNIADRHRAAMNDVESKVVGLFESLPAPTDSPTAARTDRTQTFVHDPNEMSYIPSHLRRG
ncbi:hypothetical protein [Nocardia fluminea]|uniref:hypothetical protein n=1 Tax=Nocardia fluminea TaxID=134984 RepID=UPI003D0D11EC